MRKNILAVICYVMLGTTSCSTQNDEKNIMTGEFSGIYNSEFGCLTRASIEFNQSGDNVSFDIRSVPGDTTICSGGGTISADTMNMMGTCSALEGADLALEITFSNDRNDFSGTMVITWAGGDSELVTVFGTKSELITYDVDANGIPRFAGADYIELAKIYRISKFRSGEGHDYSDDFESCRSMKHYFMPKASVDWSSVSIFSPINGTICDIALESYPNFGEQVRIKSDGYPAFIFIIFHVNIDSSLSIGSVVTAGQRIGTHIGSLTTSDIAVGVHTPKGWKLVSYFDVITDSVFQGYQARGMSSRNDAIITKAARNADPLACIGETFTNGGTLENWVMLN